MNIHPKILDIIGTEKLCPFCKNKLSIDSSFDVIDLNCNNCSIYILNVDEKADKMQSIAFFTYISFNMHNKINYFVDLNYEQGVLILSDADCEVICKLDEIPDFDFSNLAVFKDKIEKYLIWR